VEQVEAISILLPFPRLKLISEEFVQAKYRPISDNYVSEPVELVTDRVENIDLCQTWS